MVRPATKREMYESIGVERTKLNEAVAQLTDEQMELAGACEKWSVKDILSHLTDWEQRCLRWYRAGLRGEAPKTPDEKYNWRQLAALNQEIYEKYKDRSLTQVRTAFDKSFKEVMTVIDQMTEEELFSPGHYRWTRNGRLRDFVDANTASHYRWASKLVCKFVRSLESGEVDVKLAEKA